jgi:hypothetical protein
MHRVALRLWDLTELNNKQETTMTNDPGRYNTSDRDKNSNSGAWIAAAVVAVLAVFGIWYFGKMSSPLPSPNSATSTTQHLPLSQLPLQRRNRHLRQARATNHWPASARTLAGPSVQEFVGATELNDPLSVTWMKADASQQAKPSCSPVPPSPASTRAQQT